jgi:hypothetical protein
VRPRDWIRLQFSDLNVAGDWVVHWRAPRPLLSRTECAFQRPSGSRFPASPRRPARQDISNFDSIAHKSKTCRSRMVRVAVTDVTRPVGIALESPALPVEVERRTVQKRELCCRLNAPPTQDDRARLPDRGAAGLLVVRRPALERQEADLRSYLPAAEASAKRGKYGFRFICEVVAEGRQGTCV